MIVGFYYYNGNVPTPIIIDFYWGEGGRGGRELLETPHSVPSKINMVLSLYIVYHMDICTCPC